MCGLVGVFGESLYSSEESFFQDGLIASQLRGQDSTGIAVIHGKTPLIKTIKGAFDATAFVARDDVRNIIERTSRSKVFLGHTRFATHGDVKNEHAHPFTHEHITLAHNGGISNKNQLVNGDKFKVDSEAICHSISQIGAVETLRKATGAWALTYYDDIAKKFNIIRNHGRELHITKHKNRKVWYYASEDAMLFWLLRRHRIEHGTIDLVAPYNLISYDLKEEKYEVNPVDCTPRYDSWRDRRASNSRSYGGREPTTEESPTILTSSTDTKAGSTENAAVIASRRHAFSSGPWGQGYQFLQRWGLSLRDYVELTFLDVQPMTKSEYLKGWACFGGKNTPDDENADVVVFGFTEQEYKVMMQGNPEGRFYAKITQCYYDPHDEAYKMHCHNPMSTVPPAGVIVPKRKSNISFLALPPPPKGALTEKTLTEQLKELEDQCKKYEGTTPNKEETVVTQEVLEEIADKVAKEHNDTLDRIQDCKDIHNDELVEGPWGHKILMSQWKLKTKDGCQHCSGVLSLTDCDWFSEAPVHKGCKKFINTQIKEVHKIH